MLSSFVLRLVPNALASGEVVGEIVEVESGRHAAIRDIAELVAFLRGPVVDSQERS